MVVGPLTCSRECLLAKLTAQDQWVSVVAMLTEPHARTGAATLLGWGGLYRWSLRPAVPRSLGEYGWPGPASDAGTRCGSIPV